MKNTLYCGMGSTYTPYVVFLVGMVTVLPVHKLWISCGKFVENRCTQIVTKMARNTCRKRLHLSHLLLK